MGAGLYGGGAPETRIRNRVRWKCRGMVRHHVVLGLLVGVLLVLSAPPSRSNALGTSGGDSSPHEFLVVSGGVVVLDSPGGRPLASIGPGVTFIVTRGSGQYSYGHPGGSATLRGWVLSGELRPLTFRRCRRPSRYTDLRVSNTTCGATGGAAPPRSTRITPGTFTGVSPATSPATSLVSGSTTSATPPEIADSGGGASRTLDSGSRFGRKATVRPASALHEER